MFGAAEKALWFYYKTQQKLKSNCDTRSLKLALEAVQAILKVRLIQVPRWLVDSIVLHQYPVSTLTSLQTELEWPQGFLHPAKCEK